MEKKCFTALKQLELNYKAQSLRDPAFIALNSASAPFGLYSTDLEPCPFSSSLSFQDNVLSLFPGLSQFMSSGRPLLITSILSRLDQASSSVSVVRSSMVSYVALQGGCVSFKCHLAAEWCLAHAGS